MNPETQKAWNAGAAMANASYQGVRRRITINPITRLEGHGPGGGDAPHEPKGVPAHTIAA